MFFIISFTQKDLLLMFHRARKHIPSLRNKLQLWQISCSCLLFYIGTFYLCSGKNYHFTCTFTIQKGMFLIQIYLYTFLFVVTGINPMCHSYFFTTCEFEFSHYCRNHCFQIPVCLVLFFFPLPAVSVFLHSSSINVQL